MYRRIAVPLDATVESRQALRWAVTLARAANCPLDLVHVAFPPVYGTELYGATVLNDEAVDELERDADRQLRDLAEEIRAIGVDAKSVVLRGQIPAALNQHIQTSGPDLIVMTTHDRGRVERLLLGSVSESVVRRAHAPVLLLRMDEGGAAALNESVAVSRILVPLDGSPFGDAILPHAEQLAQLLGASITLLSVVEPTLATSAVAAGFGAPMGTGLAPRAAADVEADAGRKTRERELGRTAESVRAHDVVVDAAVLADGQPGHTIVKYANDHDIGLIAMTTHGRGALKRLVAGSTSEHVLRSARSPLLMYRPERIDDL